VDKDANKRPPSLAKVAIHYGLLWFLWVVLSGGSAHDLLAGVVAAGIGVWGIALVRAGATEHARFRWRFVRQGIHVPGEVMSNTGTVLAVMATRLLRGRPPESALLDVTFDNRGDSAESLGRQTLAILYETTSPNFIALTFEGQPGRPDNLRLVYHQLRGTPISKGLRRLGAHP
jgi:hypothetical protein